MQNSLKRKRGGRKAHHGMIIFNPNQQVHAPAFNEQNMTRATMREGKYDARRGVRGRKAHNGKNISTSKEASLRSASLYA